MKHISQYEIVLVNLDPTIGSEMKKVRPCVVLSPNEMNKYLQTIVVAPMTSSSKPYPTRVEVGQKAPKGWIAIDQIRTIDRKRIVKRFETLTDKEIEKVKSVIRETFVD
jgi:mRNA interferase MazF